jgi:hypothetical protein
MPESFIQLPPDSTGKKMRARERVIGANTVYEQGVFQTAPATFIALADAVAFAQNKQKFALMNGAGSGVTLNVQKLFLINVQLSTVTGVMLREDVKRITTLSGGTAITPQTMDSDNAALPAEVTCATNCTVTEGALMFPLTFNNDEVGATQAFPNTPLLAGLNWMPEGNETQSLRLREGEGFTIKQITNSAVGSFAYMCLFTVTDD